MFGDPAVYRRRQRRRAIVAWGTGAASVLLFALAVVLGAAAEHETEPEPANPFGYAMTSEQFDGLRYGLSLGAFLDELEVVARICFDSGGRLVEKLQRDAGEGSFGVSA